MFISDTVFFVDPLQNIFVPMLLVIFKHDLIKNTYLKSQESTKAFRLAYFKDDFEIKLSTKKNHCNTKFTLSRHFCV